MSKAYYLIQQSNETRGTTCYFKGSGKVFVQMPLFIKADDCYSSPKTAERYADKLRMYSYGYTYTVVDVTHLISKF